LLVEIVSERRIADEQKKMVNISLAHYDSGVKSLIIAMTSHRLKPILSGLPRKRLNAKPSLLMHKLI